MLCLECFVFIKRERNDSSVLSKVLKSFQVVFPCNCRGNANNVKSISLEDSLIREIRFFFSDFVAEFAGCGLGTAGPICWFDFIWVFVVSETIRTLSLLAFNLVPKTLVADLQASFGDLLCSDNCRERNLAPLILSTRGIRSNRLTTL